MEVEGGQVGVEMGVEVEVEVEVEMEKESRRRGSERIGGNLRGRSGQVVVSLVKSCREA